MEAKKDIESFKVTKVSNGWVLELNYVKGEATSVDDVSIFNYMNDLAEYLKTLED